MRFFAIISVNRAEMIAELVLLFGSEYNILYICCTNNYTENVQKRNKSRPKIITVNAGRNMVVTEDGEILSDIQLQKQVKTKGKSKFAIMYLDDDNLFSALKGLGNSGAIWGFVLSKYDKDSAIFFFSASVKEQCMKACEVSEGTVRTAIADFCKSGMLLKVRNAEYMVNPSFFYAGYSDARDEMIELYEERKRSLGVAVKNKALNDKISGS